MLAAASLLLVTLSAANGQVPALSAVETDHAIEVRIDGTVFTRYGFAPDRKYPYFYPVNGPVSGESVTTESSQPYPHHHSLWFACDRVNGANYWQEGAERGQIVSQRREILRAEGDEVVFQDHGLWRVPGEEPVIRDERLVRITAPTESLRFIDFTITLETLTSVTILQTNHALFSARMVPALSVNEGGKVVTSSGETGEKATWGVRSPWCDYHGERDGVTEGLAIFQHPDNPEFPHPWFTRDYGFFSPTPMQWLEGGRLDLPRGERVTLRYRVVVHAGTHKDAALAARYAEYRDAPVMAPEALRRQRLKVTGAPLND